MSDKESTYVETVKSKLVRQPIYVVRRSRDKLVHWLEDWMRLTLLPQSESTEIINLKEIRVIGLRRTGNHAITNWIEQQQPGTVEYLNNVPLHGNPFSWKYDILRDYAPKRFQQRKDDLCQQARGYFTPKDCLIYSYEDYPLTKIASPQVERHHDFYFGKSATRYDVLILRDPFNLLASRLKNNMLPVKSLTRSVTDIWIEYAKEFLGETHYLSNRKVVISYNQWVADVDYRRAIAAQLGLPFTDAGINEVRPQGGGSSFDGREFRGRATEMDVTNRWKAFADNKLFQKLLDNDELLNYSERIFAVTAKVGQSGSTALKSRAKDKDARNSFKVQNRRQQRPLTDP